MVRESIMWRFDGCRLEWLICLPELVDGHKTQGWKPLGTFDDAPPPSEIEAVRQAEEAKWTPQVQRAKRWRLRKRRRYEGSTGE